MNSSGSTSTCKSLGVGHNGSYLWNNGSQRISIIITSFPERDISEHKLFDLKMLHQTKPLNMYLSQSTMSQVLIISYSLDIKLQTFFFYSTHNFCVKILWYIVDFKFNSYLLFIFVLYRIKLILSFSLFKQEQVASVCTHNNSLIGNPGMTQVVMCFHFLEVQERFQSTLVVPEVLENSISDNTKLSVILRVKTNL